MMTQKKKQIAGFNMIDTYLSIKQEGQHGAISPTSAHTRSWRKTEGRSLRLTAVQSAAAIFRKTK